MRIPRTSGVRLTAWTCLCSLSFLASAQSSTTINLNLNGGNLSFAIVNWVAIAQTGLVAPLGNANLTVLSSSAPVVNSAAAAPATVKAVLAFNEADTLAISFTLSDPNFLQETPILMPGGVITGGTGAYAGASGSLDITVVNFGITGTGNLILGGKTTALTLSTRCGARFIRSRRAGWDIES